MLIQPTRRLATLLSLYVVFSYLPVATADEVLWPGWRGPDRDGLTSGPAWPDDLDGLKRAWRVELGKSYSGPVVTRDRVFTTESTPDGREVVRALDLESGEEIWKAGWKGSMSVPFFARANGSWIRATPWHDGERLYVAGMRDTLACLSARDGEILWNRDFVKEFESPLPAFGFVCSPLVMDDAVYVQAGGGFCKIDRKTGEVIWRKLTDGGGMGGSAFSSPFPTEIHGRSQILVQTRTRLASVDPDSGEELWSQDIPAFRGMNILTPLRFENQVFTSSYGGGTRVLEISHEDDRFRAEEKWNEPSQGYMSSPVLIDGHVYFHLRNQRMACFDLRSGERAWTSTERFGKYMSLLARGDKILALDERGTLFLLRASPERLEILDQLTVSEAPTWAHLAVADGRVVIRELEALSTWAWKTAGAPGDGGEESEPEKKISSFVAQPR